MIKLPIKNIKINHRIIFIIVFIIIDIIIVIFIKTKYIVPVFDLAGHIRLNSYTYEIYKDSWVKVGKEYYYCDSNGEIIKNKMVTIDDMLYYFDERGVLICDYDNLLYKGKYYDIKKGIAVEKK